MRIWSRLRVRSGLRYSGCLALLFAMYVLTARLGLRLDAVGGFATLVWPPTGIALAALLVFGRKLWPAISLGAFVVNFTSGAPLPVACGIAAGNTLEAVVGATLLMRVCAFDRSIGRVRDVFALAFAAAAASTLISASIGVASLWAGGIVPASDVMATWRAWWVGDALGDLVIAPFALAWWYERAQPTRRGQLAEVAMLAVLATIGALYAFDLIPLRPDPEAFRTRYLAFPVLAWASLRYRQRGGTTATLIVWIVSIIASVQNLEPVARLSEGLLPLQLFMAVVALTTLFLGAAVRERDHAEQAIRARDVFLAVASHELRTPLTSLELQATTLRESLELNPVPPENLLAKLRLIERQGERLAALVEDMLDVSRVMAGHFRLVSEPLDVGEIVREVAARFRNQAANAGCELIVEIDEASPAHGDRLLGGQGDDVSRHGRWAPTRQQRHDAARAGRATDQRRLRRRDEP
jgi:integral membrane sensor domain MASE1